MKPPIKNIAKGLSIIVLFFFALSFYSHLVYDAALNGKDSGILATSLRAFANYPNQIKEVLTSNELAGIPSTYLKTDTSFKEINHLQYNLYAVNSFWNIESNSWDIKLFNLKNDSTLFKWTLGEKGLDFETTDWSFINSMPRNCIILPDKSIILTTDESANLLRLDASSKPMWANHSFIYHHSINLDADSNIWACTADLNINKKSSVKGIKNFNGDIYTYKENYITQIDLHTGKILFHKGISQILLDNHYKNILFGYSDPLKNNAHDPLHLNDAEPMLSDSKYWKKGDILLSFRHRSLVMLYRPSTNKIIRLIHGEFLNQHDVDLVSDTEISIFNNNIIRYKDNSVNDTCQVIDAVRSSEIVIYNFQDSTFRTTFSKHLIDDHLWTETQGLHQKLSNGDTYIESQNKGKMYIVNDSGFVFKKMLRAPIEGYSYHTNWIRLYEQIPY
jgi:hypothetical protein